MKKLDEIKARRQQRFFERRMAKAKAKKRQDIENELVKHTDLISDAKVKAFILKKKEAKKERERQKYARTGAMRKDVEMLESDSESVEEVKVVATVKKTKGIKKQ